MEVSYSLAAETKGNIPEEGGGGEGCAQGLPLSARARHRDLNMRPSHNKNMSSKKYYIPMNPYLESTWHET